MTNSDLLKILNSKDIEVIEEIKLEKETEIKFLNHLEKLQERHSEIKFLNQDLVDIILNLNFKDEDLLRKFRKYNWEDLYEIAKQKDKNPRKTRIYDNFIDFLLRELGIENKKPTKKTDLYTPQKGFDIEADLKQKARRFDVEILFDYTEASKKISVNDFVLYFNRRLQYFTNLLKSRPHMDNTYRISQLKDLYETNTKVSIIGLISSFERTRNGHLVITLEDKSGEIKCFINKKKLDKNDEQHDKNMIQIVENLCLDEGIGIVGKIGKEIVWVDEIVVPSPPNTSELKKTDEEHYVVCMSDLHFGAKVFVDEAFERFLDWINGRTNSDKLNRIASKVKYILIPGDIIEGIGIYPGQGADSRVLSAELQYHEAARNLSQIPEDKCIIIIPGNHDTNRISEPQPKLPYHKAYPLYNMPNVMMMSNPSEVLLFENDPSGGLTFYQYHGGSIFYYADNIQHLRQSGGAKTPEKVIKYLLEKRHLAPSHGATLYVPDNKSDPLVIKKMPDFFLTGHTHKMSLDNYKGCTIISCGCWVEMSDYQEKMGMFPDIGKVVLVNTKTRKPNILNFYKEEKGE